MHPALPPQPQWRTRSLGCRFQLDGKLLSGIKPGKKVALIIRKLLLYFRLVALWNIGLLHLGGKFRSPLLHLVAVFGVPSQHEILFMPPHHQHGEPEVQLLELIMP